MGANRTLVEILIQAKDLTGRAFTTVVGRLRSLRDGIFSLKTAAIGFAAYVTSSVFGKVVRAFADQEAAVIRLNNALRVSGRYTVEGTRQIQAMANEMQRLTTVSDDAAIGISATLAQFTQLTTAQLAAAQKAAIGIAAARGMDPGTVAMLMGRAIAGQGNALQRYGIRLDETATQQQKFNAIMQQTAGLFDVAVGVTQSLSGQFAQAKNAAGELMETFGQIIAETFSLTTVQRSLRDRINEINARIKENIGTWVRWGEVVVAVAKAVISTFGNVVKFFFNAGQVIGDVFVSIYQTAKRNMMLLSNTVIDALNALIAGVNTLRGLNIPLLQGFTAGEVGAVTDAMEEAKDRLVTDANDIDAAMSGIVAAWQGVIAALKKPARASAEFDVTTAGGGSNTGQPDLFDQDARDKTNEAGRLLQDFALGGIGQDEFLKRIETLAPAMLALRESGKLTHDTWVALAVAFEQLKEKAVELELVVGDPSGPDNFAQAFAKAVRDAQAELANLSADLAKLTFEQIMGFTAAVVDAFGALSEGSKQSGKDFQAAMLGAVAAVAGAFAQLFAARAGAAIAEALLPSSVLSGQSAGGLAAAGYFTAAALAMSALAGALRGAASRTAGGGGGGGASGAAASTNDVAREQQPLTVILRGPMWRATSPEFVDLVAAAFGEATSRNVIIQREE